MTPADSHDEDLVDVDESDLGLQPPLGVRVPSPAALLEVLGVVLEARIAAQLGDGPRADRCIEAAAEALVDLMPSATATAAPLLVFQRCTCRRSPLDGMPLIDNHGDCPAHVGSGRG